MRSREKSTLNNKDIIFVKDPWYFPYLFPLYLILGSAYFYWRISITMRWNFWLSWPLLIADFYVLVTTILFLLSTRKVVYPLWKPPIRGKIIDILIPTKNEPTEIVEMTTVAAQAVNGVNQVFILNDGNRSEIRDLALRLGVKHISRQDNIHAKAGIMNLGLKHTQADFVIFQDCDFVPQQNMIERMLGYFRDSRVAFVQCPQVFYNKDKSIQHRQTGLIRFWNEQTMFYEGIQPAKNYDNAVIYCGTNAMLRRQAIDDVGGFATGTATEDIHTSLRLQARGWKAWYIKEYLAFGLAPEDIKEYYKQRARWGAGSLGLLFRSKDSPLRAHGMTFKQRISYIGSTFYYTSGLIKIFYFGAPVVAIFTAANPVKISFFDYWIVALPFLLFSYFVAFVHSRGTFHPIFTEQFNILNIFSNTASLKSIWRVQTKFGVSIKSKKKLENKVIYNSIVAIMAIMLIANWYALYYWFYLQGGTIGGFLSSDLVVAVFWNNLNLALVISFLNYLKSLNCRKIDHPINLTKKHKQLIFGSLEYQLENISLQGATVLLAKATPWSDRISLPFSFNGKTFFVDGKVEQVIVKQNPGTTLKVRFDHLSQEQRKLLIYFFFHKLTPELYRQKNDSKK